MTQNFLDRPDLALTEYPPTRLPEIFKNLVHAYQDATESHPYFLHGEPTREERIIPPALRAKTSPTNYNDHRTPRMPTQPKPFWTQPFYPTDLRPPRRLTLEQKRNISAQSLRENLDTFNEQKHLWEAHLYRDIHKDDMPKDRRYYDDQAYRSLNQKYGADIRPRYIGYPGIPKHTDRQPEEHTTASFDQTLRDNHTTRSPLRNETDTARRHSYPPHNTNRNFRPTKSRAALRTPHTSPKPQRNY